MDNRITEKKRRWDGMALPSLTTSVKEISQNGGLEIQSQHCRNNGRGRGRGRGWGHSYGRGTGRGRGRGREQSGQGRGSNRNIYQHRSAMIDRGSGRHYNQRNLTGTRNQRQNRFSKKNIQHFNTGSLSIEEIFNEDKSSTAMTVTNDSTSSESPFPSSRNESPFNTLSNGFSSGYQSLATISHNEQRHETNCNKTITILHWPNPSTHYIPLEEETRLIPFLIHWGKSERGMMKDQPPFRLEKILRALGEDPSAKHSFKTRWKGHDPLKPRFYTKDYNTTIDTNTTKADLIPTQRINLIQALSLRRHHLKLLNPRLSMSALRLGNENDVRDAALIFEQCVEIYLKSQGVEFWTEEDQRKMFEKSRDAQIEAMGLNAVEARKKLGHRLFKQPPTPDFMMKDNHCIVLSYTDSESDIEHASDLKSCSIFSDNSNAIHWIEAKMFYGASSIPAATSNAVGCILPKARDYVAHYGTGAIVFMYGCGEELARQLAEIGVVALDGRGLDIQRVVEHQRGWCGDSMGNILF